MKKSLLGLMTFITLTLLAPHGRAEGVDPFNVTCFKSPKHDRLSILSEMSGEYYVLGDRLEGVDQDYVTVFGNARLYQGTRLMTAPEITYDLTSGWVTADKGVCFREPIATVAGESMRYQVGSGIGELTNPVYSLTVQRRIDDETSITTVGGYGKDIVLEGDGKYKISGCRFTSCHGTKPDWYLQADEITFDTNEEIGTATQPRIYFKDVPILGLPWLTFPLNDERRSGFLSPFISLRNRSGVTVGIPYYWNIAPNYDATITPSYSTRRGPKVDTEFRYLLPSTNGTIDFDYVPHDLVEKRDRYAFTWENQYANIAKGVDFMVNYNRVSDLEYFSDYSNRLQQLTQSVLIQEAKAGYYLPFDRVTGEIGLHVQKFQSLDPEIVSPYERLPQLTWNFYGQEGRNLDWNVGGQFTYFFHKEAVDGKRFVIYPNLQTTLSPHAGVTITPKAGLHFTRYWLSDGRELEYGNDSKVHLGSYRRNQPDEITRALPIVSVDSTAVFERNTSLFGNKYMQTLEPRLYYLYVPNRNQNNIPIFDTGLMDVNFASIFSENVYSGEDRIADANDLTLGVTTRLIDGESGTQQLEATVAQRIYFESQHVGLPGESLRTDRRSDLLAGISAAVIPNVTLNSLVQYGISNAQFRRIVFGVRYHPEAGKTLSVTQRFYDGLYNQIDIAGQWPLSRNLFAVGRYSYSFRDSENVETLLGLEYASGCWAFRLVGQRLQTVIGSPTTALFAQLELNGLGNLGSNPTDLLRRSISGYQLLSDIKKD